MNKNKIIALFGFFSVAVLLNILFLNATTVTNNYQEGKIQSVSEYQTIKSEIVGNYRPGDIVDRNVFIMDAQSLGWEVKNHDQLIRVDTRSPGELATGFNPNRNIGSTGTLADHIAKPVGNYVSTSLAGGAHGNYPIEFVEYTYGVEKPVHQFTLEHKGSLTPPPPKEFISRIYLINNVEGAVVPNQATHPVLFPKESSFPNSEVIVRDVPPDKIQSFKEMKFKVESWKKVSDQWVPDRVTGDVNKIYIGSNRYEQMMSLKNYMENKPKLAEYKFQRPNTGQSKPLSRELDFDKPRDIEGALVRDIVEGKVDKEAEIPKLTSEKPVESLKISSLAKAAGTAELITAISTIVAAGGNASQELKQTNDPIEQTKIINRYAEQANSNLKTTAMVIGGTAIAVFVVPAATGALMTLASVAIVPITVAALCDQDSLKGIQAALNDPKSALAARTQILQAQLSMGADAWSKMVGVFQFTHSLVSILPKSSEELAPTMGIVSYLIDKMNRENDSNGKNSNELEGDSKVNGYLDRIKNFAHKVMQNVGKTIGVLPSPSLTKDTISQNNAENMPNFSQLEPGKTDNFNSIINVNSNINIPKIPTDIIGNHSIAINNTILPMGPLDDFILGAGNGNPSVSPLITNFQTGEAVWFDTGKPYDPSSTRLEWRGDQLLGPDYNFPVQLFSIITS